MQLLQAVPTAAEVMASRHLGVEFSRHKLSSNPQPLLQDLHPQCSQPRCTAAEVLAPRNLGVEWGRQLPSY